MSLKEMILNLNIKNCLQDLETLDFKIDWHDQDCTDTFRRIEALVVHLRFIQDNVERGTLT